VPLAPRKGALQIKDPSLGGGDKLLWKWSRGPTLLPEFGDPRGTTSYALCIWDESGGTPVLATDILVPGGGTCSSQSPAPCWSVRGAGYQYKDKDLATDGIKLIKLKADPGGNAQILVKGKGPGIPMPVAASGALLLAQDPAVTVQFVASTGACWETRMPRPALKNSFDARGRQFKDKTD
jgi:hypothetical protein